MIIQYVECDLPIPEKRKGEKTGKPKLTVEQVKEIRLCYANGGITHRQLSLEYGVRESAVCNIINRKRWKNI